MKEMVVFFLVILLLISMSPMVCYAKENIRMTQSRYEVLSQVETLYTDWTIGKVSDSNTMLNNNVQISLYRIKDGMLWLKMLRVSNNRSENGETTGLNETDSAPIPVNDEAAVRFDIWTPDQYDDGTVWLDSEYLPGCAEFMLRDGEGWEDFGVLGDSLVGVVLDENGRKGLRTACWDGSNYSITASHMWENNWVLNTYNSGGGNLELMTNSGCLLYLTNKSDGVWRLEGINNGYGIYFIMEDHILDATNGASESNNDYWHYGRITFPTRLDQLDIEKTPLRGKSLLSLLDSSSWACVRENGTPLFDAPDGKTIASAFARLTGTIAEEKGDWVCLQIGSESRGIRAWFLREQLVFGKDIEDVRCGFPSYEFNFFKEELSDILNRHLIGLDNPFTDQYGFDDYPEAVWLIARLSDGRFLTEVNGNIVGELPADAFSKILPTEEYWPGYDLQMTDKEWQVISGT